MHSLCVVSMDFLCVVSMATPLLASHSPVVCPHSASLQLLRVQELYSYQMLFLQATVQESSCARGITQSHPNVMKYCQPDKLFPTSSRTAYPRQSPVTVVNVP